MRILFTRYVNRVWVRAVCIIYQARTAHTLRASAMLYCTCTRTAIQEYAFGLSEFIKLGPTRIRLHLYVEHPTQTPENGHAHWIMKFSPACREIKLHLNSEHEFSCTSIETNAAHSNAPRRTAHLFKKLQETERKNVESWQRQEQEIYDTSCIKTSVHGASPIDNDVRECAQIFQQDKQITNSICEQCKTREKSTRIRSCSDFA